MATKKRSRYVKNVDWDRYKHVVQKFLEDDSGRQTIGWCRHIDQMLMMGEDKSPKYTLVLIEALCYYNAFRNWPINKATVSGELDDENLVILIPKSAVQKYLNDEGYFQFNWSEDRFIINGIGYAMKNMILNIFMKENAEDYNFLDLKMKMKLDLLKKEK